MDGRSGFRLSPQRRTRRREWRREGEAEEGEATSLPGLSATRDAGTQEGEDGEEAVAAAPHAHTATASPPPGSARRAAAAARHAGSEGWCRRPPGLERGAGPATEAGQATGGGAGCGGRGRAGAASGSRSRAPGLPSLPADHAKVPAPSRGIMGEGISDTTPSAHPPKHSPESARPP